MRYVELFAGGGGLSHGLDRAGWTCVAHAEIEPHARAVLRAQWPTTPLLGDVSAIDGTQWRGLVDVVSGGSPCQDMSVAGKRAGMSEGSGTRSSLFFEQVRIWQESEAPFMLWENVYGAFSSNNGYDFAAVLSALCGRDLVADGAVRPDKRGKLKWLRAGRAVGPAGVVAWRVLDLQHFGPPQRRVRVFIVAARTGARDPGEILLEREGVCGHPSPREQARESVTGAAARGAGSRSVALNISNGVPSLDDTMGTLDSDGASTTAIGAQTRGVVVAFTTTQTPKVGGDVCHTLEAASKSGGGQTPAVVAFHHTQRPIHGTVSPAIAFNWQNGGGYGNANDGLAITEETTGPLSGSQVVAVVPPMAGTTDGMGVLAFNCKQDGTPNAEGVTPTLTAMQFRDSHTNGGGQMAVLCATGDTTHALTHEGADASEGGTGRGTPIVVAHGQANAEIGVGVSPSLTQPHEAPIVVPTLSMGAHTAGPGSNGQDAVQYAEALRRSGVARPRRLTPKECERLQGWPDSWTQYGVREDGTRYALSDTARYRICGNGVGSPCAEWIARRFA